MKFPEYLYKYYTNKEQTLIKEKVLPFLVDDLQPEKGMKTKLNSATSLLNKFHIPLDKKEYKEFEKKINGIPYSKDDEYYSARAAEDLRRLVRDVKYRFFESPNYWIRKGDEYKSPESYKSYNDLLVEHEKYAREWTISKIEPELDNIKELKKIINHLNELDLELRKNPPPSADRKFGKETGERIKKALTDLTKEFKEEFIAAISKNIDGVVDRYITWAEEQAKLDFRKRDHKTKWPHHIGKLVDNKALKRVANYNDIVKEVATATATELLDKFIYKNTMKIGTIVEKKGNLSDIKLAYIGKGSLVEGIILFEFDDKSSFRAKSKMVYNQTMYGDMYVQYPTTFHDIVTKDGEKHSTKPEAWMINSF